MLKIVTFIIDDLSNNINGVDIQIDAMAKEKILYLQERTIQ